jgi:hypothetical protein
MSSVKDDSRNSLTLDSIFLPNFESQTTSFLDILSSYTSNYLFLF